MLINSYVFELILRVRGNFLVPTFGLCTVQRRRILLLSKSLTQDLIALILQLPDI